MTTQHHVQTKPLGRFRSGMVSRSSVLKIVAILGILIGMGMIIQQNNQCQNELKQYQALQLFLKIDDLGHEGITDLWKRRDYNSGIQQFEKIDIQFHDTKSVSEKFKLAKEMDVLFEKIDAYFHEVGGVMTPEEMARDKKYHEIDNLFNQLK